MTSVLRGEEGAKCSRVRGAAAARPTLGFVATTLAATLAATACGAGMAPRATPVPTEEGRPELLEGSDLQLLDGSHPVRYTVDGDTFIAEIDGQRVTVRLIGIDAPESGSHDQPLQCFGRQATERASQLLDGASVKLALDPSQGQFDRFGRLLAYAWLDDGRLANLALLKEGMAYEYTYDWDRPYALARQFRAARDQSEREGRGLWSAATCGGRFDAPPVP